MTLLSPTCYDRQDLEQFPLDFVYHQDQNVFCVHSFSTIVWSANDSSQRALTHSDLRVCVSAECRQPGMLGRLMSRAVRCELTSFRVFQLSSRCVCEESLNWLPVQLSCPTQRSSFECTVEHMSHICRFVHSGGISDCACFQRWATMRQLETMLVILLDNITRITGKQDVVWVPLWG